MNFFKKINPFLLILISVLALVSSFDSVDTVSNVSWMRLLVEHGLIIEIAWILISKNLRKYNETTRLIYFNLFLCSYIISIVALNYYWVESLVMESNYDPARYYRYAIQIITGEGEKVGLNYYGVVYFYAFSMRIFGIDPVVPLFVNMLLTLYAVLCVGKLLGTKDSINKYALLLIIPEVILYDIYSSREILCTTMATICIVKYIELHEERNKARIITLVSAFLLMGVVRPPMAFVLILIITYHILMNSKSKYRFAGMVLIALLVVAASFDNRTGYAGCE